VKEIEKLATPDYEKYEGIVVHEDRGVFLSALRLLSYFEVPKLAIVVIGIFALAILWKGELTVVIQTVVILAITAISIANSIERKLNAPASSNNGKSPLELGHARRNKGAT
jgi:hypothetical protein